jgi:hypothetical protein
MLVSVSTDYESKLVRIDGDTLDDDTLHDALDAAFHGDYYVHLSPRETESGALVVSASIPWNPSIVYVTVSIVNETEATS